MKWIKEHHEGSPGSRGWNNYRSDDGVFFIRQNSSGPRWIITTTDGSKRFNGPRGVRSHVAVAYNIEDAKSVCASTYFKIATISTITSEKNATIE